MRLQTGYIVILPLKSGGEIALGHTPTEAFNAFVIHDVRRAYHTLCVFMLPIS